ncbi:PAS domain S-box-containing protein [Lysobacter sp. HA35]
MQEGAAESSVQQVPHRQAGLGESERQFRLLVQGVTDYAIYMLDIDGRIASWNAGGQRIKGYKAEEIIGQHFSQFYTDDDRNSGEPARALQTARTEGRYEKEGWRLRKDGTRFWANVIIDPVYDEDGKHIGFAKITRDITERREQQRALEVAQQAMLQAHRMEAIGQLTYGVAHDFNNLLTVITNSLDLLGVDSSDPQRTRRLIAGAQRAAERGSLLTRQLLAYSRKQTLRPEVHDLNSLIYAGESVLRRGVGENIDIELSLGRGLGDVNVDAPEFEAALLNLVVNARDAMPEGGRITIGTREHLQREREGRRNPGRYVLVTVEDTGTGMSPEVIEHAMEPFFTTKDVGKGSGLGLSQVYGFAVQSGGDISIDSHVDKGTTISFYLPVTQDHREGDLGDGDSGAPIKVLLVEDDADVQAMAVESLRYLGYSVLTADEGAAALEILTRDPEIQVLFTDVVMPKGMSGVDLFREALRIRPELRVLLASGYARGQLPTIPDGCDFIAKPYRVEDLGKRLAALLGHIPTAAASS